MLQAFCSAMIAEITMIANQAWFHRTPQSPGLAARSGTRLRVVVRRVACVSAKFASELDLCGYEISAYCGQYARSATATKYPAFAPSRVLLFITSVAI